MAVNLTSQIRFQDFVVDHPVAMVYFHTADCGVCKAVRPKLEQLMNERFPAAVLAQVDCSEYPQLAAQHQVFTVPTLLVFLAGREQLRRSRAFGLGELARALERPYALLVDG
jgi:thioredoxin-like negative regulator of GroEL